MKVPTILFTPLSTILTTTPSGLFPVLWEMIRTKTLSPCTAPPILISLTKISSPPSSGRTKPNPARVADIFPVICLTSLGIANLPPFSLTSEPCSKSSLIVCLNSGYSVSRTSSFLANRRLLIGWYLGAFRYSMTCCEVTPTQESYFDSFKKSNRKTPN